MSTISTEELTRLAEMARIALTDEEIAQIAEELEAITSVVDKISAAETEGVAPTYQPVPLKNVARPDTVGAILNRSAVLGVAPAAEEGQFAVPQMLEEQ